MKNSKGITLTSLIVTIIVMVILAGIALLFSVGEEGIIERANESKRRTEFAEFKEKVGLEYLGLKNRQKDKETIDLFRELDAKMQLEDYFIGNESFIIKYDEETYITLLKDGTIIDGKKIELNIADGSIELRKNGFVQGKKILSGGDYKVNGTVVEYSGDYIITGTTIENIIRVAEEGIYNITLMDLKIDVSSIDKVSAFNANAGKKDLGCFVNVNIEGDNSLYSGGSYAGLHFVGAKPNIEGEIKGSTLTINGNGNLYAKGGKFAAGIGGGYVGGDTCNIIINGGNITASGTGAAASIGGGLRGNVNNLIINGGNIITVYNNCTGIGTRSNESGHGNLKNLIINGGNITAYGGEYGSAIGGAKNSEVGEMKITGGNLNLINNGDTRFTVNSALGSGCTKIDISGGTIICNTKYKIGIGTLDIEQNINVNGGNIYINSSENNFAISPKSGNSNVYLTEVKLNNVEDKVRVTNFKTSDNIFYGIEDMYTLEDGMLYLYLPEGEREIKLTAGGKTYTGTVTVTPENTEVFFLN